MADTFKYGQMLISNQDTEVKCFSGRTVKIPKGNRVVIGFDKYAHHLSNNYIQPLAKDAVVEGFSHTGVVAMIWKYLNLRLPMEGMLDDYDLEPKDITDAIKEALEEISLYDYKEDNDE